MKKKIFKIIKIILVMGVILVGVLFFAALSVMRGFDKPSPTMSFDSFFDSSIEDVRNLKAEGSVWLGHDVYLSFESDKEVIPEKWLEFKEVSCQDYFKAVDIERKTVKTILKESVIKCSFYTDTEKSVDNGRLFVRSIHNNKYFFRGFSWD